MIKPLGKLFRTPKTDYKTIFSSWSYKSLKLEFVCSPTYPLWFWSCWQASIYSCNQGGQTPVYSQWMNEPVWMNTAISHLCFTQPPHPTKKCNIQSAAVFSGGGRFLHISRHKIAYISPSFTKVALIHKFLPHSQITPSFTNYSFIHKIYRNDFLFSIV